MGVINVAALTAAAALCISPSVDVHGWVQKPLARQYCNGDEVWCLSTLCRVHVTLAWNCGHIGS